MIFDVSLKIKETTTDIGTDIATRVQVERAESGFYIASGVTGSPLIASGTSPQNAILEYLSSFFIARRVCPHCQVEQDCSALYCVILGVEY